MLKGGCVYIMASPNRSTLYIGVSSALVERVWQHRTKYYPTGFTARYNCVMLVFYKYFESIEAAIAEEKRPKKANRAYKDRLIESENPNWDDLWFQIQT